MLRIRLRRIGKKKQPQYRLVVANSRSPRDGAFLEILGQYNPLTDPATVTVNEERTREWLRQGAQPSDTVAKLLVRQGILDKPKTAAPEAKAAAPAPAARASRAKAPAAAPAAASAKTEEPAAEAAAPEPEEATESPAAESTEDETAKE